MHVRRAMLLFAVVLVLAAVVASISEPGRAPRSNAPPSEEPGTAAPRPPEPAQVKVDASKRVSRRLPTGRALELLVKVDEPGQVELVDLGLEDDAEPAVPARFDVFERQPTETEVRFTPFAGGETRAVGRLVFAAEP